MPSENEDIDTDFATLNATVSVKKLKVFGESVKLAREGEEKINISLIVYMEG